MEVTFEQLWAIANKEAQRIGKSPNHVFLEVGLRLEIPVKPWEYYCTPTNVKTFASTGCDGIHYSFLELSSSPESPIVMTVPANSGNSNVIVGENLYEFLCLGSKASYILLENLSDEYEEFSFLKSKDYAEFLSDEQIYFLNVLSKEFSLHPWSAFEERISYLQLKYLDLLQLPGQEKYFDEMVHIRDHYEVNSTESIIIIGYQDESSSYDSLQCCL